MRSWKPGDVVSAFIPTRQRQHRAVYIGGEAYPWRLLDSAGTGGCDGASAGNVKDARPLLVIDPENPHDIEDIATARLREGIEAVLRVSINDAEWERISAHLQAALRSLLDPEPEEPTQYLSRVMDANGGEWVRLEATHSYPWIRRNGNGMDDWSRIPRPITVLSPGYTEDES